jgi:hypothetical protein
MLPVIFATASESESQKANDSAPQTEKKMQRGTSTIRAITTDLKAGLRIPISSF